MQKKVLIILAVVVVVGVIGGLLWFRSRQTAPEVLSPAEETSEITPTQTGAKLLTWNDPAGFSFQYPAEAESDSAEGGIKVNKHPEDNTNYANLDFYIEGKEGGILIMASDTKYASADDWATKDKKNSLAGGGTKTTLGGKVARKISFPSGEPLQTIVGTVNDEILFTVGLKSGSESFWQNTFDQIVSTFTFVYPTSAPASKESGGSSDSDVIEEEEIIE